MQFIHAVHSFYRNHTVQSSVFIRWGSSPFPHSCLAQWEKPPWGAEPRIELGPALQQAGALPTELRRTLTELRRTLTELRRTLTELRRTLVRQSLRSILAGFPI